MRRARARASWNNINIAAKGAAQILRALWKAINHCPKGSRRVQDRYSRRSSDCGSSAADDRAMSRNIPGILHRYARDRVVIKDATSTKRSLVYYSVNGHCLFRTRKGVETRRFRNDYEKRSEYRCLRDKASNRCHEIAKRDYAYVGHEQNVPASFRRMMLSLELNTLNLATFI